MGRVRDCVRVWDRERVRVSVRVRDRNMAMVTERLWAMVR